MDKIPVIQEQVHNLGDYAVVGRSVTMFDATATLADLLKYASDNNAELHISHVRIEPPANPDDQPF